MKLTLTSHRAGLAALLALCAGCIAGPEDVLNADLGEQEQAIYNGELVTSGPFAGAAGRVVSVGTVDGRSCTGVLISSRWVLTAAHCVVGLAKDEVWVHSPWGYVYGLVQRVVVHDQFHYNDEQVSGLSEKMAYAVADLALIELDTPVVRDGNFMTLLPFMNGDPAPGQSVTCYGFGYANRAKNDAAFPLRKASLQVGSLTYLEDEHSMRLGFTVHPNALGQDLAEGDSGGPCFDDASGMLAGISSSTTYMGPYKIDVSADVIQPSQYIGWIAPIVADEITSLRMIHTLGRWRIDLTNTSANNNVLRTPKYTCMSQRSCSYPLDWQDSSIVNGNGSVVLIWQCGRDPTVYTASAVAPLAGHTLSARCVTMRWIATGIKGP